MVTASGRESLPSEGKRRAMRGQVTQEGKRIDSQQGMDRQQRIASPAAKIDERAACIIQARGNELHKPCEE